MTEQEFRAADPLIAGWKQPAGVFAGGLQDRFEREPEPFNVEAACQKLLRELTNHT